MLSTIKKPSLLDAILPVLILIILLSGSVYLFGEDSSYGPNQIGLLFASGIVLLIGLKNGHQWKALEEAMVTGISISMGAIFILLAVGSLIGTWLLSGTVPSLIYFGLHLIEPSWFYVTSCLLCAIVAMSIGSSWTTAATIGVALIGIANGLDISTTVTAGAIVSGAYFGDKISPLSETTNLAPAVSGSELFTHIRSMLWTTVPSFVLALIFFTIMGSQISFNENTERVTEVSNILQKHFDIHLLHLIPLLILLTLAYRKVPAFPAVAIGALLGGIWAAIFQQELISDLGSASSQSINTIIVVWKTFFDGVSIETGDPLINDLLSGGGMSSMLNTTWLIMMALMFGSIMDKTGLLRVFVEAILKTAQSVASLIISTMLTCIGINILAADQYMAIVMPGRMFKEEYERRGLANVSLSRSLEDGGTITSPLIPWNTCGAYMHSVLLVNPLDYAIYAVFNWVNPLIAMIYAYFGFKIARNPATQTSTKHSVSS